MYLYFKFYAREKHLKTAVSKKLALVMLLWLLATVGIKAQGGTALNFDGVDDKVEVLNHPSLNISSAITLEAWMNHSKNIGEQNIVCKSSVSVNNSYAFPRTTDGWATIQFWLDINGIGPVVLSVPYGRTTFRNQWHHVAATYDGFFMRIYIDGVLKGSKAIAGEITVNNNPLILGGHTGLEEYFGGKTDDIRIWNRALTQCEIANNKNCELTGSENGLVAYYKLNTGIANAPNPGVTTAYDATSNANDGQLDASFALGDFLTINWTNGIVSGTCIPFTPVVPVAGALQSALPIGSDIYLTASGGDTYSWTGPNGFTSTQQNPVITGASLLAGGTYTVVVTKSGCSASASVLVTIAPLAKALIFDGVDNLIRIPNSASLNMTNELSIETWIYPTRNTPIVQNIVSKSSWSENNGYIFPRTDDGWQNFSFWLAIDGQWKVISAPFPGLNQWTHVAATYDGFFMKIYINGVLVGTLSAPGIITENTNAITIGQQDGFTEYFKGGVDEIRIWGRALPQCEIQNNQGCELNGANNGLAGLQGLAAYYRFNQGLVNVNNAQYISLADSSGHNNHGNLIGFDLIGTNSNWSTGGSANNGTCSPYIPVNVVASSNGPVLEVGATIQLQVTSGTAWSWTGPLGFTSSLQNPTIPNSTVDRSGIYSVTVTGNGCTSVANTSLHVAYKAGTLHFDGVNDQVTVPNGPSLNIRKAITLEAWIRPTNNTKLIQTLMSKSTSNVNTGYIFPRTDDAWTSYIFYLHINGTWQKLSAPYPSINEWHHVAATYDGFWMRIYLDGVLSASKLLPNGGNIALNANDLVIGQQPGYDEYFQGNIEEARVWDRALSQCEIINNMDCEVYQLQNNGLVAYYKFNQGFIDADNRHINSLTDASPNANHGLLQNFNLQGIPSNWSEFKINGACSTYAQPPVEVSSNGSIFGVGSTVKLFATGAPNYEWEGPNNFSSLIANPTLTNVQTNATGVYTVTARFVRCAITVSKRLTVSALQPIHASGPTTFCPSQSVTLSTNQAGTAYQWFLNGVEIQGANSNSFVVTASGDYGVSVTTATDVLISVAVTVTEEDNLAPVVTITNLPVLNLLTPAVVNVFPTALDNCAGTITGTTQDTISFDVAGEYQITWTYNDGNNNTFTQTQTVVVEWGYEPVPPVLTVPSNITLNSDVTFCGAVAGFTATATDNRPEPVTIHYSHNPGSVFPAGTTIVIVTATDASGNIVTGDFTVTVNPTVVAPVTGNTTLCAGSATTLSSAAAGGTWSSGNNTIATVNQSGVVTALSAGQVVISYTDACGVSASATVTVNAIPSTPVITVINNCESSTLSTEATGSLLWSNGATGSSITVSVNDTYAITQTVNGCISAAGSAVASPKTTPPAPVVTVANNCGSSTLSTDATGLLLWSNGAVTSSITVSAAGTNTVKQTVDGCESAFGTGVAAPKATPSAPVVTVVNNCGSSILSTDAIGSLMWSNGETASSITVSVSGAYTVRQIVGDCVSAEGSGMAAPKIIPSTPVIAVVNNCGSSTLLTNATGSLQWSTGATTSAIAVTNSGEYSVIAIVNGCTSTASMASVIVIPVPIVGAITGNTTVTEGSTTQLNNGAFGGIWSSNNTPVATVDANGLVSGVSVGNAIISYTVTLESGCSTTVMAPVTVNPDCIAPVITASNVTANTTVSDCNASVTYSVSISGTPAATVTYTLTGVTSGSGSGTGSGLNFNKGETTVIVTANNTCGSVSEIFIVTVNDITPPVISCPANTTVYCGASTLPAATGIATATDNCGTATVSYTDAVNDNIITRIWIATDGANTSSCTQTITTSDVVFATSIASIPTSSIYTGGVSTNLFIGYGTQSTKLQVNVPSTGGPFTYEWSGSAVSMLSSATSNAPIFTPVAGNSYTFIVTVKNANGCTSTSAITICVTDIRVMASDDDDEDDQANCDHRSHDYSDCGHKGHGHSCNHKSHSSKDCSHNSDHHKYCDHKSHNSDKCQHNGNDHDSEQKVYICHVPTGNPSAKQTLVISINAVADHLKSHTGDRLGSCSQAPCSPFVDTEKPKVDCPSSTTVSYGASTAPAATGYATGSDNSNVATISYTDASNRGTDVNSADYYNYAITRTWKATDASGNYSTCTQKITTGLLFTATVASKPTNSTYTGGVSTNLYLGYGAQSTRLEVCALPSSGAPYTYAWSGSATNKLNSTNSSAPTFTPTIYGSYTFMVTVTNKYGSTSTAYISICVTDIRVPGTGSSKVYLCHKNKTLRGYKSYQTLEVSINSVAEHLENDRCGNNDNDDRLGSCDQAPCNTTSANSVAASNKQSVTTEGTVVAVNAVNSKPFATTTEEELKVTVMPNPSTTYFTLKFDSRYDTPIDIRVMDDNGRIVDSKSKIGANSTIRIGHNYSSGMYYAEINQNGKRKVIQLIKARG